jgi:hypothetical protein
VYEWYLGISSSFVDSRLIRCCLQACKSVREYAWKSSLYKQACYRVGV